MDALILFRLGGLALLLVAAGLAWAAWRAYGKCRAFLDSALSAQGTVIDLIEKNDADGSTWAPKVRFRDRWGREVVFESGVSTSPAPKLGSRVAVRYRGENPDEAEIDSFLALWLPSLVFGFLGAGVLAAGIALLGGWVRP